MLGETQLPVPAQTGRKRRWSTDAVAGDEEARDGSLITEATEEEQAPMEIADSPITRGNEGQQEEEEEEIAEIGSSVLSNVEGEASEEPQIPVWDSDDDDVARDKTEAELQELHIASVKSFTELDPRKNLLVHTRFCSVNIGGFDLDRESKFGLGPPLYTETLTPKVAKYMVSKAVNVISVKVIESDRGYPISVYGTVIARDAIDYRCVYLFRRAREDPQTISSEDDMLTLTGPQRGLVPMGDVCFELNLRVKGDAGDEDFSKGVLEIYVVPNNPKPITRVLNSWLSRVELVLAPVEGPVAASLEVKILTGEPPLSGKICVGASKNPKTQMVVYDSRDTKSSSTVVLSRNLVAVPEPDEEEEDDEIVVYVRFLDDDDDADDEDAGTLVNIAYPTVEQVCNHGAWELQVNVAWTAILSKPMAKHTITRGFATPIDYQCPRYQPLF